MITRTIAKEKRLRRKFQAENEEYQRFVFQDKRGEGGFNWVLCKSSGRPAELTGFCTRLQRVVQKWYYVLFCICFVFL